MNMAMVASSPAPVNPPARPPDPEPAPPVDDGPEDTWGGFRCPGVDDARVVRLAATYCETRGYGASKALHAARVALQARGGVL